MYIFITNYDIYSEFLGLHDLPETLFQMSTSQNDE